MASLGRRRIVPNTKRLNFTDMKNISDYMFGKKADKITRVIVIAAAIWAVTYLILTLC